MHGELCDRRNEAFCLNQCSGHGTCDEFGGFCHCDERFFGIDCSMTRDGSGRVALHSEHAAVQRPRSPSVYVYELWDHTSLILQYKAYGRYCAHRSFHDDNTTVFNDVYAYAIEPALHERMLSSPHRTVDGENADYYYVPTYTSCTILPVYDWVGPGTPTGYPMRPVTAMRMAYDAMQQVRTRWPYFNRTVARATAARLSGRPPPMPDHLVLFSHDEGACWAPELLFEHACMLTHWGRMDERPRSSSRYIPDNWERNWIEDERAPAGQIWSFPSGSRRMIGTHPCYRRGKDIVIPVFASPAKWERSPWLSGDGARRVVKGKGRRTLAYFSGNLALNEPLKYARGIRHRLYKSFSKTAGWRLENKAGPRYSRDLSEAEFCLVPPGGDGWSSRVDDAVRHGCIPVVIMDNVHMPFETSLNYSRFALRVAERDVELLDHILRSVSISTRREMRTAMQAIWTRFTYAQSFLDADSYLPVRRGATATGARVLPRAHLAQHPLDALRRATAERGMPDAFDTIMLELHSRLMQQSNGMM